MSGAAPCRPGTVVWVELATPDNERAIHFYERLFGWRYEEQDTEDGIHVVSRVAAGEVAGMTSRLPEWAMPGARPRWMPYVGTEHLQATVARACDLGGWEWQSPTSTHGRARVAVIADPAGAAVALMESPPSDRRMVRGEFGGVPWVDCLSRDAVASRDFYEKLLGWRSQEGVDGYVKFDVDGEWIGGLVAMPGSVPAEVPSYWLVHFAVGDVDEVSAGATEAGGAVLEPAGDVKEGRVAVLEDPAGTVFAVFESRPA